MEHRIVDREEIAHPDGTWILAATCACGWSVKAGPFPSKVRAELSLESAFARHTVRSTALPDLMPPPGTRPP